MRCKTQRPDREVAISYLASQRYKMMITCSCTWAVLVTAAACANTALKKMLTVLVAGTVFLTELGIHIAGAVGLASFSTVARNEFCPQCLLVLSSFQSNLQCLSRLRQRFFLELNNLHCLYTDIEMRKTGKYAPIVASLAMPTIEFQQ